MIPLILPIAALAASAWGASALGKKSGESAVTKTGTPGGGGTGGVVTTDPNKLSFLDWLNRYFAAEKAQGGTYGFGDAGYVRYAPMYNVNFGIPSRAYITDGGNVLVNPLNGNPIGRGEYAALSNYIQYNAAKTGNTYGLSSDTLDRIIEAYVNTVDKNLGRSGPTISYISSVLPSLSSIVGSLGKVIAAIGGVVAAPFTAGASLAAVAPLVLDAVKK